MYLKKFTIRNFRAIEFLELDFSKGLNIIIGENNAGKTAVIDALRLCLGDFQQPRDIYCRVSDFRIEKTKITDEIEDIRFDLIFECENKVETAYFNDLHALDEKGNSNLQLHFRYELIDQKLGKKVKRRVWGGEKEGGNVSYEVHSALRNVYLSALRNTNRDLRPIKGNVLGNLYSQIPIDDDKTKDHEKKDELLEKVRNLLNDEDWNNFIGKGNKTILEHLEGLSYLTDEKRQYVEIDFIPFDFDKFVQNLIIQLPIYSNNLIDEDHTQKYFEISQNGLGYNNLIYTATVLGDIKNRKENSEAKYTEYTLLLIEEPEAHLHPQLQNTFFNYLKRLNEQNEFQIIVTSHSPTIAAKTDLKLLTILQNRQNKIYATHIKDIDFGDAKDRSLEYLQKFLDVTRSQLFFSNGVILVEGISEALLIPIFSRILGERYDVERNGIEVVNVNGVAFKHFAKLFNSQEEKGLECKCAIITDDDEGKKGAKEKVKKIKELENENLKPNIGNKTFEYELFKANADNEFIFKVFSELHENLCKQLIKIEDIEKKAQFFVDKIANNKSKSKFAYLLAMELEEALKLEEENSKIFNVPNYIEEAIKFVVDGSK